MGWQALSNRIRARRTGSGLAGEAQRATIRTVDGPLALSASLTLSPAHPLAARLSLALWPMEDDSYPPGNFAPEEPVAEDVLEAGEGEAYGVADVGSSSTVRGGKRKREAPPPNATLTSEQVQAKLVRSGPGATGRKIALGLEELKLVCFRLRLAAPPQPQPARAGQEGPDVRAPAAAQAPVRPAGGSYPGP